MEKIVIVVKDCSQRYRDILEKEEIKINRDWFAYYLPHIELSTTVETVIQLMEKYDWINTYYHQSSMAFDL